MFSQKPSWEDKASPVSASLSTEKLLKLLVRYLRETGRRILLTVDKIDYYTLRFDGGRL
ncbi:MAG: hypothetical protein QXE22_07455 [Candidatus Bathyarchaeia archaeon]